jgi:dTDP-4-dehydrorhamnose reductase
VKIAVLGSLGQLGRDLCPRLQGDVIPLARSDFDLTDHERLRQRLTQLRPDAVVNCAAYNFVDRAESEPEAALAVNAFAVRNLAQVCRDLNALLVHFSTDYIFGLDSARTAPWREEDAPGPVSVYGLSKLAGEYVVRSICPKHFIVRTCGLYGVAGTGGKGGNFVETMLRAAGQGKALRVVGDQRCTPSFTADVAAAVAALIPTGAYGLYHITNDGDCSWHEFAREIFRLSGLSPALTAITSAEYGAPARRPAYSVFSLERFTSLGLACPRRWQDALAAYLRERQSR